MTDNNPKTQYGIIKPPVHLVPPVAILSEAMVFKLGASKYGAYNWRKNDVSISVYYSAAMRHMGSYWDGEDIDPESGESHISHARACLAIIMDAMTNGNLVDDRPPSGQASNFIRMVANDNTGPSLEEVIRCKDH